MIQEHDDLKKHLSNQALRRDIKERMSQAIRNSTGARECSTTALCGLALAAHSQKL